MRMTIDLRLSLKFLPLVVLPFVASGKLEYDWYRGGTVNPPDNATYNGQPQSIVKVAKLDGVDIGGIDEEYVDSNGTPLPGLPSEVGSYTATVIFPPSTGLGNLIGQTFTIQQDTLTVAAISGYLEVVDVFSRDADGLLATLAGAVAGTCLAGQTATHRAVSPVLVLTPEHAHQLAERFTKTLVKQGVWEQASLSLEQVGPRVKQQVMERRLRRGGEDANGPLRPCPTPEDIIVVVAGGIGQKSAYLPAWYGGSKAQIRPIRT